MREDSEGFASEWVQSLRLSGRGSVNADAMALVSESAEESLGEGFVTEEVAH